VLGLLKRLRRRVKRTVKRELRWLRSRLHALARRREMQRELRHRLRHRSRKSRRRRSESRDLSFRSNEHWAWSLRVLEDGEMIASMHAANPLALLSLIEEYVLACGDPLPPYSVVLRRNANGKSLVVDRNLVGSDQPTSDRQRVDAIRELDNGIDRYLERYGSSSSVTVMTDPLGNPVGLRELISHAYCGSQRARNTARA
jgi:hypothetical protein